MSQILNKFIKAPVSVGTGGTGQTTLTAHSVLVGAGSSAVSQILAAASGTILIGTSGADPSFSATPTLGVNGTTTGQLLLATNTISGQSITIQNRSTTSAWNFNLPTSAGSAGQVLTSQGGGTSDMTWTSALSNPMTTLGDIIVGGASGTPARKAVGANGTVLMPNSSDASALTYVQDPAVKNLGVTTSVASNALTITVTDAGGNTPSSTSPVVIPFNSVTGGGTGGKYAVAQVTATLTITVPSGATLGHTSGVNQYIWVYALNNSGTAELAVSGIDYFDDGFQYTTTTISAGATSGSTLYSTTGRSSVNIRLLARIKISESTAGTWATAAADVSLLPTPQVNFTNLSTSSAITITGTTTNPTKGTTSTDRVFWRREGQYMYAYYEYTQTGAGSAGSGDYLFLIPGGYSVDTNYVTLNSSTASTAQRQWPTQGVFVGNTGSTSQSQLFPEMYDSTHFRLVGLIGASNNVAGSGGLALSNSSVQYGGWIKIPISGWSNYGP